MILVFHGGLCCGIKTIHSLPANPQGKTCEVKKEPELRNDKEGRKVASDLSFFTDAAPQETYLERFDRMVAFCERERPGGIIEVVTADLGGSYYSGAEMVWGPLLRDREFVEVNSVLNSNSGNVIHIYHRKTENWSSEEEEDEDETFIECDCEDCRRSRGE